MVIGETNTEINKDKVNRLLVCSGRVYSDLVSNRAEREIDDVAIIRVEQLYPFPHKEFEAELQQYPNLKEIVWVQDEPQNQGPWFYIQHHIYQNMSAGQKLSYAGRAASSSPAVGYLALHNEQLKSLLEQAFSPRLRGFTLTK